MKKIIFLLVFAIANSLALEPFIKEKIESFCEQFPDGIDEELLKLGEEVLELGSYDAEHECSIYETEDDCAKVLRKMHKLCSIIDQDGKKYAYMYALLNCVHSIRDELIARAHKLQLNASQFNELQEEAFSALKKECKQCISSKQNNN